MIPKQIPPNIPAQNPTRTSIAVSFSIPDFTFTNVCIFVIAPLLFRPTRLPSIALWATEGLTLISAENFHQTISYNSDNDNIFQKIKK